MVVVAYPPNGYRSVSTVKMDFFRQGAGIVTTFLLEEVLVIGSIYALLDGMNEKGFCVAVNMIQDAAAIDQHTENGPDNDNGSTVVAGSCGYVR